MELFVAGTLASVGYLLAKKNKVDNDDQQYTKISKNEKPSMQNVYNSKYTNEVAQTVDRKAKRNYDKAQKYKETGVIPLNLKQVNNSSIKSSLAGVEIPIDDFKHNNMVPYFGGSIKQNVDPYKTQGVLERFTGVSDLYMNKKEIAPLNDTNVSIGNVYGMESIVDFEQERMVNSQFKNNVLPFKQIKVGVGLNQGINNDPTGGFHQDIREFELDRGVDDLRTANNPKTTYDGRILDGQKHLLPATPGAVVKNRVETFHESGPDTLFTTVGAYTKEGERPTQILKDTVRKDINTDYTGIAYDNNGQELRPDVQGSSKQQLKDYGLRNKASAAEGNDDNDYGKSNILVYTNERDITTTKTYEGNLTSLVKSVMAPLQDAVKFSNKEYTITSKRPYGNMQTQFPNKLTIYDPNDIARTTIKETSIHDTRTGNVTGEYNKVVVYDPDDILKTTLRQTLPNQENSHNLRLKVPKGTIYDPSDVAKTALKELTEDGTRTGNLNRSNFQDGGGYKTNPHEAQNTNRQFTTTEYGGIINDTRGGGDGYKIEEFDAQNTNRQFTSEEYGGIAGSKDLKAMSYEDKKNAIISDLKESLLDGRVPTTEGAKTNVSKSMYNMQPNKLQKINENENLYGNLSKIYEATDTLVNPTYTKEKVNYQEISTDRLDPNLLKAYKQNIYTQSLHSAPMMSTYST